MRLTAKRLATCWPALPLVVTTLAFAGDLRLVDAARHQDRDAVRTLLQQHIDVNAAQDDGARALHWAAYFDDAAIADLLIRAHANVNAANELGVTPLALASSIGMVEKLLAAGANP